jgi:hypothetical protein
MDEMLALEVRHIKLATSNGPYESNLQVAWYQGANLAQTVFTCLYYLHPDRLDGPNTSLLMSVVFKAFLLGYCKSIDLAFTELSKGHLHDVEDCWMDHYGIAVHLEDSADSMLGLLDHALGWLDEFDRKSVDDITAYVSLMTLLDPYRSALQSRIQLRIELLALLHVLPAEPSWHPQRISRQPKVTWPPSMTVFDNVTPYLRQVMPPSEVSIPSHEDAWSQAVDAIRSCHALRDVGSDLLTWEIFMRSKTWRREDWNIVRSLYKVRHF